MRFEYVIHYPVYNGNRFMPIYYDRQREVNRWKNQGFSASASSYNSHIGFDVHITGRRPLSECRGFGVEETGITVETVLPSRP